MVLWRVVPIAAAAAAVISEAEKAAFRSDGFHVARGEGKGR